MKILYREQMEVLADFWTESLKDNSIIFNAAIPEHQLTCFKQALIHEIWQSDGYPWLWTDYYPTPILVDAANQAWIDVYLFPIKITTVIEQNGSVVVIYWPKRQVLFDLITRNSSQHHLGGYKYGNH